jgi:hypothetical protein
MRSDPGQWPDLGQPLRSTTFLGPISSAVAGRLWRPDPAEPELAAWWRPLVELSRRLRADLFPWPILVDEYDLVGRVDRPPRARVWLYRHHGGPCELAVDDDGRTYRFVWSTGRRSLGRLKEVDNRGAVHRAGLTDLIDPLTRWGEERQSACLTEDDPLDDVGP